MAKLRTRLHLLANQARLTRLEFFPLRKALVGYRRAQAVDDFKAALNVALLAFPQAMAYAAIAGLPIQYGVYGSAIAALLGPMLGGSRLLVLGPTNATAVLLFGSFLMLGVEPSQVPRLVPLVCLMTGVFLLIGAFLRVANLIQFVSRSVIAGYITAAAVYIIANQMSKALGITFEVAQGYTLLDIIWRTLVNLPNAHLPTVLLSALTACVYFIQKKAFPRLPNVAITLVLMSLAAWGLNEAMLRVGLMERYGELAPLSGIDAASWSFTAPRLTIERVSLVAQTALLLAFLSILESASVGKSVAARAGLRFDVSQEMLGMAMANIGCAFLNGMPASGSPVRSQLNWNSGAASPLSSIMSGLIVAVAAFTLGPFTRYIPSGALGVLVIAIGLSLFNRHVLRVVLKSTRSDALVFVTTLTAALFVRLDFAIILGTATSIMLFLRKAAVPQLVEYGASASGELTPLESAPERRQTISIVHVEGELFFGAAELFRDQMRRVCEDPGLKVVVLKLRNAHHLDATSILALEELIHYMRENGRILLVSEARKEAIRIFKNSGLFEVIGRENIFPDNLQNPTLPTAKALRRAKALLAGQEAKVSIYLGTQKRQKTAGQG